MNLLSKTFRTTCIPQMNRLDTPIPSEYVGREIEIIIIPLESNKKAGLRCNPQMQGCCL
jgi:hypothetical protein